MPPPRRTCPLTARTCFTPRVNEATISSYCLWMTIASRSFVMPAAERGNHAKFSPDGRWVVYRITISPDEAEIYVRPFPPIAGGGANG